MACQSTQLAVLAPHTTLVRSGLVQQDMDEAVLSAAAVTDANSPHWLIMTPSQVLHLPMGQSQPARSAPASARQGATPRRPAVTQAVSQLTGKMPHLLCSCHAGHTAILPQRSAPAVDNLH